jgi:ribosomal protein L40E
MSIVSAIATSDFGGPVKPNELLPLIIEPLGQRELTHTVAIPVGIGAGTHSLTFHIEVTILTIEGWSSQRTSSDQTVSFTVEQPQMTFVVTQPTAVIGTEIISVPTMPTSGPSASTYEWVPLTILLVALIVVAVGATWYGRSKRAKHPKEPETVNIFCVECGAQNPTTNEYCGKCGNSLVARPTH